jgi:hypothetical protein
MDTIEPVSVAVLAKAPVAGFAKTRLIPVLGADGAALLQAQLIERAVGTARAAAVGPVILWAAPDHTHPVFRKLERCGVRLACQREGDLGARMIEAISAVPGPVLVIGTDCPALGAEHLHSAADLLRSGSDVVIGPAEDGGYVLIGMRCPRPELLEQMPWSTGEVMQETRRRLRHRGLAWQVDRPEDLERLANISNSVISDENPVSIPALTADY